MSFGRNSWIGDKYLWTEHSRMKMRHYRLTESRVKRVIRHPARIEEGVLENGIAVMQPAEGKKYSEIWAMYVLTRGNAFSRHDSSRPAPGSLRKSEISAEGGPSKSRFSLSRKRIAARNGWEGARRIKIITAWRYPGKSPARDPVPAEILKEIRRIV